MVGTRDGCSGRERGIEGLEERGLFHGGGLFSLGLFMRRGLVRIIGHGVVVVG